MNLLWFFVGNTDVQKIFFRMNLRKFLEITNNKPIFIQYNIFYNHIFFQCAFWSLFNSCQRSQSNQEQYSLSCSSPCFLVLLCAHYGSLQCFSTYFRKSKVLRPMFPRVACWDVTFSLIYLMVGTTWVWVVVEFSTNFEH